MAVLVLCLLLCFGAHIMCIDTGELLNIVTITAEDIGWDDISLHGSDLIYTTNIDMIGIQGITLQNYYTDCQGTPSMSAFYTGKYPMKIGTQGSSIGGSEDRGVPITEKLLPSYLQELGYTTHLVGKWQLGKSRSNYLPTNRGFNEFMGCTSGVDYMTYNHMENINGTEYYGLDFFHNLSPVLDQSGHHLTNVLTNHAVKIIKEHNTSVPLYLHVAHAAAYVGGQVSLQATREDIAANNHIAHTNRRQYAALVTGIDNSVGEIMAALSEMDMEKNTLVIFLSHNGAASIGEPRNYGSNLPLKGSKGTPYEGAVRSIAVLWHAAIKPAVWNGLFHVADWMPTLVAAASYNKTNLNLTSLDGINQWDSLINNEESKRQNAIIAIDDLNGWGAFRDGDFKIIVGNVPRSYGLYGNQLNTTILNVNRPTYEEKLMNSSTTKIFLKKLNIDINIDDVLIKRDSCNLNKQIKLNNTAKESKNLCVPTKGKGCLFNITADPEEAQDLWDEYPHIVQPLSHHFRLLWSKLVPRRPVVFDPKSDPQKHDFVWRPWVEDDAELPTLENVHSEFPLDMSAEELRYVVNVNLNVVSEKLTQYMKSMADTLVDSVSGMFGAEN